MITKSGNSDRDLKDMVSDEEEMMHINLPSDAQGKSLEVKPGQTLDGNCDAVTDKKAVDDELKKFGPEAGKPPETIEEKIKEWAHDVAGSDAQADEILGQDDRTVQHSTDMAEHIMDLPEGLDTLVDPAADDTSSVAEMHVVQFQGD